MLRLCLLPLLLFPVAVVAGPDRSDQHRESAETDQDQHQHRHDETDRRDRDRWMWQLPARVIRTIGVRPGMTVADVGAGEGYFTYRLAEAVGETGRVIANDIDREALAGIDRTCRERGITNVTTVVGRTDDPLLPETGCDLILLVNVFHLLETPGGVLERLKSALRPGGKLVFVQWDADKLASEDSRTSESDRLLYSSERLEREVVAAGFETEAIETFLPVQNIFVFRPAP